MRVILPCLSSAAPADPPDPDLVSAAVHAWRRRFKGADAVGAAIALERAHALMTSQINQLLKPLDLNVVRYEILTMLAFSESGALTLGQISAWLMVHPTSVTNNIDRLEAQGYVRRGPHPSDRRVVLAEVTSSGHEVVQLAAGRLIEHDFGLTGLTKKDMVTVSRILRQIS
jgi:DNA-binding MarR family transcriptional regulator